MAERRIGGAGGGSDKAVRPGTVVVTAVAGVALASGLGGTAVVGGGAAGTAGVSGSAGTSVSLRLPRLARQHSKAVGKRLSGRGMRVRVRAEDSGTDCADRSYGRLVEFFHDMPCSGVHRALFEVRGASGDIVLVAVSWVQMPDEARAAAYREVVDTHGTGNIIELSRERGRHRDVRFTGHAYASRQDGTVVVNAQAQPVARGNIGLALTELVNDAVIGG